MAFGGQALSRRTYRCGHTLLSRHLHKDGYLALVLSGGYDEAGDRGCFRVQAGDVLLHSAFEAHLDRYHAYGADVLDLPLPSGFMSHHHTMSVPDADAIMRVAERDPQEALALALSSMQTVERGFDDWPHHLALAIERDLHLRLDAWACENHLAMATVSRGFRKVFGISPSAYRAHLRARRAAHLTASSQLRLDDLAQHTGFADQAHMTHAVRSLTGMTPGAWRRQVLEVK